MQMISLPDALRGRWASHPLGWLLLLVPNAALVVLQETTNGFPSIGLVLLSALIQHVVAGGFLVGAGILALRALRTVPVVLVYSIWTASGVIRGFLSGWLAVEFAGGEPEYLYRIAYWTIATLVWMPLFTYLLAQLEFRRQLLAQSERLHTRITRAESREKQSVDERAAELVTAVRDTVAPLIVEARNILALAADRDSTMSLEPISAKLEVIASTARSVVDRAAAPDEAATLAPARWSPVIEALAFARARPFYSSVLTCIAVVSLFLPESLREDGLAGAVVHTGAVVAGGVVVTLGLLLARLSRHFTAMHAAAIFVAGAAMTQAFLLVIDVHSPNERDWALVIAGPLAFTAAAAMLSSAIGIGLGNLKLVATVVEQSARLTELTDRSLAREAEITLKVSELLHGPILGRLSACIMALNFYLAESEESRGLRRDATTTGVLAHLQLVADDLEKLAGAH